MYLTANTKEDSLASSFLMIDSMRDPGSPSSSIKPATLHETSLSTSLCGHRPSSTPRRECSHEEVASILQDICDSAGDVSLHRVTRALAGGEELLDPAGRRAMLPSEDVVPEEGCGGVVAEESGAVLEGRTVPCSDSFRVTWQV